MVGTTFEAALVAAAATEPLAFGAEENRNVPELITTEVANTAFSSSRLQGIMLARITPPATLAALAGEELGLIGLPALERLLLRPPYAEQETLANRCRLAVPIAANVRTTALVVEERWRRRAVDPQWTPDEPELADRLRLRDLIQALIDVSDRLDRDVTQFGPDPLGNERLPFADKRRMEMYLASVSTALLRETGVLRRFAPEGSPARDALARVTAALEQGRELLDGSDAERASAVELFDRAQQEVAQLPAAFDFAPEAFQRPLASFEATAGVPDGPGGFQP
jgi:predicted lipoprotein